MQEAGLRTQLAATLRRRDVPDKVWDLLVRDGYVPDVLEGEEHYDRLVQRARDYLDLIEAGTSGTETEAREFVPKKGTRLWDRMQAVSVLLAHEAAKHEWVVRYRRDVLQDQLLDPSEVESWVMAQYRDQEGITYWATEVPLPVGTLILQDLKSGYLFTDPPLLVDEEYPTIGRVEVRHLSYVVPGDARPRIVPITSSSALGRLWRLNEKLEQTFGWNKTQSTMFVLTGEPPIIPPAWLMPDYRMPYQVTSRITLEVDPAVSPNELVAFYRKARKEVLANRHRTLSEKHLQLAKFVASRPDNESWSERLTVWNEQYPEWKYPRDMVKNFSRDCQQARERLLHPAYRDPREQHPAPPNPWLVVDVERKSNNG